MKKKGKNKSDDERLEVIEKQQAERQQELD
jgi:hypothetical protein